ncbi:hypothetical protein M0Q97_07765 [Candidatus Dojkabacteria bacterium]|jgi:hypothetical protein|nr:hypothetical protein [Candidatus Dojkabacteria bacterium]
MATIDNKIPIIPDSPLSAPTVQDTTEKSEKTKSKDQKNSVKKSKFGYLDGYAEITDTDIQIAFNKDTNWKSDWERSGQKRLHDSAYDLMTHGFMYRDDENNFRYNTASFYEDPTYLGYNIKIDMDSSPLFNYGDNIDTQKPSSALNFIKRYSNIPDIANREPIWNEFVTKFTDFFGNSLFSNPMRKSHYIESITGLEKLTQKFVKYREDKLTIQLTEDVSLRSSYLAELYNNLCYSYKEQRYLIPENCLRFDMMIEITDIRSFKILNPNFNGDPNDSRFIINNDPPRIIYTLHDCNLDFFASSSFDDSIALAGYNSKMNTTPSILKFDIIYKSISKEFRSTLIPNSFQITNKTDKLINDPLSKIGLFSDIKSNKQIEEQEEQEIFSNFQTESEIDKNLSIDDIEKNLKTSYKRKNEYLGYMGLTYKGELLNTLKGIVKENIVDYANDLKDRFNNIRGTLINEALRQVREPFQMPEIYPDNVYNPDFRKLSLENFGRNLGSDILNVLQDEAGDFLNNLLSI